VRHRPGLVFNRHFGQYCCVAGRDHRYRRGGEKRYPDAGFGTPVRVAGRHAGKCAGRIGAAAFATGINDFAGGGVGAFTLGLRHRRRIGHAETFGYCGDWSADAFRAIVPGRHADGLFCDA